MTQTSGIATVTPIRERKPIRLQSQPVAPLTASGAPANMTAVREAYSRRAAAIAFSNARRAARGR